MSPSLSLPLVSAHPTVLLHLSGNGRGMCVPLPFGQSTLCCVRTFKFQISPQHPRSSLGNVNFILLHVRFLCLTVSHNNAPKKACEEQMNDSPTVIKQKDLFYQCYSQQDLLPAFISPSSHVWAERPLLLLLSKHVVPPLMILQ